MSIDAKTQFLRNVIYLAKKYDFSFDDIAHFLGVEDKEQRQRLANAIVDYTETDGQCVSIFMPTYDEAGRLATLAGVELFEVFSRSLKRLDELGELPQ